MLKRYREMVLEVIPQGRVVLQPKASQLKKFPQRPTAWASSRPVRPPSRTGRKGTFFTRQTSQPTRTAPITPP